MPSQETTLSQFYNRRRRRQRFLRLGAGFSDGAKRIESAGTGITAPVTAAELLGRVTMVFDVEFFGAYPNGVMVDTGVLTFQLTTAGVFGGFGPGVTVVGSLSENIPPNSIHTVVVYFEVRTVGTGLTVYFIDGVEIARGEVGTFTAWGTAGATWDYMNGITDIGNVKALEVFPGFRPASVVG